MSYAIFFLVILAMLHFIYESILAPSFRMKLHFDLCALRDELRRIQWVYGPAQSEENLRYLNESLRALASVLHRFDVGTLAAVRQEMTRNPALRKEIEQRGRMLEGCAVPEAIEIRERLVRIACRALLVNHGAWCIYVVPVAFGCFGFGNARRLIGAAVSLPVSELSRIMPNGRIALFRQCRCGSG
jgi:hypothetical protein